MSHFPVQVYEMFFLCFLKSSSYGKQAAELIEIFNFSIPSYMRASFFSKLEISGQKT